MPLYFENGSPIIKYDFTAREIYWKKLSEHLIDTYGNKIFTNHNEVEKILISGFNFLIEQFRKILLSEEKFDFFCYVFDLHEESIKIYVEIQGGYKLKNLDESEFSMYRRILKLILEQGCDINLNWEKGDIKNHSLKLQDLIYLGHWIYNFADFIALHKMIEECHFILFDEEELLVVDWNHHYGKAYRKLFPEMISDYLHSANNLESIPEFLEKIQDSFKIDYGFAMGQIHEIKEYHNPNNSQTIETYVLPINLSAQSNISIEQATLFYNGLTISRENKLSIENTVYKPYSTNRYFFRPILEYNINGVKRALIGEYKLTESIFALATNSLNWNIMLKEWLLNPEIKLFVNKKALEHDKILEDKIEKKIIESEYLYCRNIKSFKQNNKNSIRIDNQLAGEIDFIIINQKTNKIFVCETKYNKPRYECIGFRTDYTNFLNNYEPQLNKKLNWINDHRLILQEHLRIIYNLKEINIEKYSIEGIFLINTPTFYMFNGNFKAITLNKLSSYLSGIEVYPEIELIKHDDDNSEVIKYKIPHPYFKHIIS